MIDKIKLLNEILDNNPELKDKKKSIENIIDVLIKNNPNIKADNEFKKKLKSRLDTIVWMEDISVKKLKKFIMLIHAFSFVFVIWLYFYFIWTVDFFHNNEPVKINKIQENKQEISIPEATIFNDELKKIDKIFSDELDNVINKTNEIENTQIIDLLWESELNQNLDTLNDSIWESMIMKTTINNFVESEVILDENINNLEQKISFEEFCLESMWDLINISGLKICIVEGKQCTEENYNNDVCNFIEIE